MVLLVWNSVRRGILRINTKLGQEKKKLISDVCYSQEVQSWTLEPIFNSPHRAVGLPLQFIIVDTQIYGEGSLHETTQLPKTSAREQCKY